MAPGTWTTRLTALGRIDRRWLYLALLVALVTTVLLRPVLSSAPSPFTQPVFAAIEALPAGAPVLVTMEYSPGSAPEIEPMAEALTRHLLWRGARPVYVSLWPEGNNMFQRLRVSVLEAEFADRVEGRDWVALGYKAGRAMAINSLRQDLRSMYTQDLRGVPLDSCPAVAEVHDLGDFALIVALSAGTPGLQEWILYAGDPTGVPLVGGCTGVGMPEFLAYFPGQLVGLIGGLKGAAEYETALASAYPGRRLPRPATIGMGPQTVAHALILLFLLLGNLGVVASWASRRRGGRR